VTAPGAEPDLEAAEPLLVDAGFPPCAGARVSGEQAALLAATLDLEPDGYAVDGVELPLPWHWACFLPTVRTGELGPDGHPRRRPEMTAFSRRMWVGGRVREVRPLVVGEPAERASAMQSTALKDGSSGRFWLITVAHTITQSGETCIEEEQDLALRGPATAPVPAPGAPLREPPDAAEIDWVEGRAADPILLFRYSALTFNAHRIHYDAPYATREECYPGLVVQGPLLATLLCESARRHFDGPVRELAFRARVPVFAPAPLWLAGRFTSDGAELTVVRSDGETAMTLTARR
jgi:3-methylfumaryl-CoA hydratase